MKKKASTKAIPGISVMDRYITWELIIPFLFAMGLFTSLGLSIGMLFELVRKVTESGLPVDIAIQVFILKMPEFIVLAFPMSILLATLMAYGRLSADSELIALRSIGVSIYRLVIPGILLSLVVTGCAFVFNEFVAPSANYQATITLKQVLKEETVLFKQENIIYPEYQPIEKKDGTKQTVLIRLFYAEQFDGEKMRNLTILDRSQEEVSQIVTAEYASWNITANIWDFFNGTIYVIAPDGSYRKIIRFKQQQLALPRAPLDLAKNIKDYDEMNFFEARRYLQVVELGANEQQIRKFRVRMQEKIALPFVCVVFGLIGSTIGVRPQHTNKATSFGICVVLVFSYYLLSFITSSLGISGILSPFMAAWLPNSLGLISGSLLLFKSAQ